MSKLEIVIYPDPRLREKLPDVEEITDEVKQLLSDMAETMYAEPGIGLAANQVGSKHRVIVVDVGDNEETGRVGKLYKLVNPRLASKSGEIEMEEGCLSIPDVRELVRRPERVTVKALDENGKPVELEAEGLLAVCLQHEIDHLDGVLFIDHLSKLKRDLVRNKLKKSAQGNK